MLYRWTKFQCHTLFISQDIKHVLLSSLKCVEKFKIFLESPSNAMADKEKRRGR